jgi:hypothetical protein
LKYEFIDDSININIGLILIFRIQVYFANMNYQSCQVCYQRQVHPGSVWCGNTCRFSGRPGSANYQQHIVQPVVQFCQVCHRSQVHPGSVWCNNTCRFSGLPGSANYQQPVVQQQVVQQGTPLCRICYMFNKKSVAAYYDGQRGKYAPGCTLTHSRQALQLGLYHPL